MALTEKETKKKKRKKTTQTAKDWSKPRVWEYLPEEFYYKPKLESDTGYFPGEEGPPIPIDEFARGGPVKKKKKKKKKPRGWGKARYKGK